MSVLSLQNGGLYTRFSGPHVVNNVVTLCTRPTYLFVLPYPIARHYVIYNQYVRSSVCLSHNRATESSYHSVRRKILQLYIRPCWNLHRNRKWEKSHLGYTM